MEKATTQANSGRISVFIVEDSAAIRERLVCLLEQDGGITVVGEAETPGDAVEGILRTRPDSVVLDIHLVGGSGLEVLEKIRPVAPGTVFVVLTNHPNSQYRRIFAKAGASCFLDKNTEFQKVRDAVSAAGGARHQATPNLPY